MTRKDAIISHVPEAFVFMKVGNHAGETFEEILARKHEELVRAGMIFWGYGGSACHPLHQVQPFVRIHIKKHGSIYLLMEPVDSRADPDLVPATEYSADGVTWNPIPDGINVTGSRYALVLDEIQPGDLQIQPGDYEVGIGPSRGKSSSAYIQGRVDKACLVRSALDTPPQPSDPRHAKYLAKLKDPFSVLVR